MTEVAREVARRFVATFPMGPVALLRAESPVSNDVGRGAVHTVLIHGRHEGVETPLAVVMLADPSLAPDDPKLLEFVVRRARANKVPYFFTWTLRDTIAWKTPKSGVPAARDSLEKLRDYPDLFEVGVNANDELSEAVIIKILERGSDVIRDLHRLLRDEALELVAIDATYFVGRLLDAVRTLLPLMAKSLHARLQDDVKFRDEASAWAVKQAIAGDPKDPEFARSIARQIIYRLLGKVLFYQSLRRSARSLPKLELDGLDSSQVLPTLRRAFGLARAIDYHAVFDEDMPDRINWPSDASTVLAGLVHDFNTRDFAHLPQDVVGTVFEQLIPPEERHTLGQYFTSENLCDLVTAFCVRSPTDVVLDPTCGTGTFLIRAYDRLRSLGCDDHAQLLSQLWGIDIAPFPAELATINLFRQRIAEHGNFPRIICRDFIGLSPGDRFPFPPPKMDLENPETIDEAIPQFDAVIGNFPYVSAAQIESLEKDYLSFLGGRLIDDWFAEYPDLFSYKNAVLQREFEKLVAAGNHLGSRRSGLRPGISGFADLYVYMFLHTTRFLKPKGRMGIVTSNAWLDTEYGRELALFFADHFKIVAVLESRCEPWFTEAAVNTVVTVLERCEHKVQRDVNLVRFVKVKRALAELIPGDPITQAHARWNTLSDIIDRVERAGQKFSKTHPLTVEAQEDSDFRIRITRQSELRDAVIASGGAAKWGRYLRAPDIYFDLSKKAASRLCPLRALADMKFGSKSGINEFYHLSRAVIDDHGIEPEYVFPLVKAAEDASGTILIDPAVLKKFVFVCRRSKADLRKLGHKGALKYIEWGEKQKFDSGKLAGSTWPNGIEVRERRPGWYSLPAYRGYSARLFWLKAYHDTYLQRFSDVDLIPDQRLYFLEPEQGIDQRTLAAVLNSYVVAMCLESIAPVAAGEGVCEVRLDDARVCLLVPDLRAIPEREQSAILEAFQPLLRRSIGRVADEVRLDDRQALDSAVLRGLGLDPKKYLKPLYDGLCELVQERLTLGQLRGKAKKTKARGDKAEKQTTEAVLDELLPQGPRRFPEDFFSPAGAHGPHHTVSLPDSPLVFESSPMFSVVHGVVGNFEYRVKTPAEGKFLLYAHGAGQRVAEVPTERVEISRTVANYEKYLKELRQDLYDAYYRRTLDTKAATRLVQSAFERFHLPPVEP